jgi:predicted Zn finger-like uncharacterized protein
MSLVTRCPACGTVFRVVQDQLKVSEGWVRCGRCSEVFNAVDGLFDLDHDDAVAAAADSMPAFDADERATLEDPSPQRIDALMQAVTQSEPPPGDGEADAGAPAAAGSDDGPALQDISAREAERELAAVYAALTPLDAPVVAEDAEATPAQADHAFAPRVIDDGATGGPSPAATDPLDQPVGEQPDHEAPTPEFLRRAERAARWRHPGVRAALALLALLLAAALAAQLALHYRDVLAAQWPPARPWLARACQWAGCRIEPPRRIDALSVDSSGLLRAEGVARYRLSLVLNNRADTDVLMPAIDLTLTDQQGRTLVRRVLSASELGAETAALAPRTELALQGVLDLGALDDAGERRVNGYTVELFYP